MSGTDGPATSPTSPTSPTTLSTHVLDAALGAPAAGLALALRLHTADSTELESAVTDADGRVRFATTVTGGGTYAITFETGAWFAAAERDTFYPSVTITFAVDPEQPHYHVALLLSPYSYTTYRGS